MMLLFILLIAGAGAFILYPNDLYAAFRASLPDSLPSSLALPNPFAAATPTQPPTATSVPSTATVQPTATSTQTPTSTPYHGPTPTASPAFGGGTGEIAFASDRSGIPEIYLSNLVTKEEKLLINMPGGACEPAWSPDGAQIVFVSPCPKALDLSDLLPNDTQLYIARADGSDPSPMATVGTGDSEPAWSPDGKQIAFTSVREGPPLIYIITLENNKVKRLIDPIAARASDSTADFAALRQPAWSRPSGDQIVFAAKNMAADGAYQIWSVTDAAQGLQRIVSSGTAFWDYLPTWSPDGKTITFSQRDATGYVLPKVMRILYADRGGPGVQIKGVLRPIEHFDYSPDGLWYAFVAKYEGENKDIYYSTTLGEQSTRLTFDRDRDFDPAWRP
jgi:Tol biopolymer transport system component